MSTASQRSGVMGRCGSAKFRRPAADGAAAAPETADPHKAGNVSNSRHQTPRPKTA